MYMNKSLVKTLFVTVAAGTLTVSCGDDTDVQKQWESKVVDSEFNEYFKDAFGDIASDQDFRMVGQRTMNIANIGGDINTEYTIYVCQGNPNYEDDAMALYQTKAQGQSAVSFTFDMPTGLDHVWVVRSAPDDQVASYVSVLKTAREINVEMESGETKAQVSEATVNEVTDNLFDFTHVYSGISGHTYTMTAPSTVLENKYYDPGTRVGYEFKAETGTYSGVNLYNYSIQGVSDWNTTPPCTIYVAGNVTIEPSCYFFFIDFYIPSGSTLTYNGSDTQGVRFHVKEGGKLILNVKNIDAHYSSWPSEIVNEGEVIINGKGESSSGHYEMTDAPCTITFPLNSSEYTTATYSSDGISSTNVSLGWAVPFVGANELTVNGSSRTYAVFQPSTQNNLSFAENPYNYGNYSIIFGISMTNGYTFKPTRITGNMARTGTNSGNIDIFTTNWSENSVLATGLIPYRNYTESNPTDTKEGAASSFDLTNNTIAGQSINLVLYMYNMSYEQGKKRQFALNNVVISGISTKTEWVEEVGDPAFAMSNYCNFYNAGKMTINCDMEFNPADGNETCDFFTNYDGATLTAQTIAIGGKGAKFANAGTVNLSGDLKLCTGSGGGAQTVNIGTLTAASLDLDAGVTHFYNGGSTVISGLTQSSKDGNTWVNNGYYKTQKLKVDAGNSTFYNYCQLIVTDEFYLHDAAFNNMPSSYAQATSLNIGNFTCYLHDNSVLYVTSKLHIDEGKGAGSDNGFHGVGTEYALVAARQMDVLAGSSANIQFLGNVEYAWNTFRYVDEYNNELTEEQAVGKAGDGNKIMFYAETSARNVCYNELSISEPDPEDCGAEWNPGGGPTPSAFTYTLAYEDLGSKDDFDFNDIVLRVSHTGGTTEGTVQFVAAGGTLKISIAYDGETLFSHTDGVMYATGGAETSYTISQMPGTKKATITMADDFTWTDENCLNKFTINVTSRGGDFVKAIPATTQAGYAPQCLVIPNATWQWPTGRTSIKDAYPNFAAWVADKTVNTEWYNYPASGMVYTGN